LGKDRAIIYDEPLDHDVLHGGTRPDVDPVAAAGAAILPGTVRDAEAAHPAGGGGDELLVDQARHRRLLLWPRQPRYYRRLLVPSFLGCPRALGRRLATVHVVVSLLVDALYLITSSSLLFIYTTTMSPVIFFLR